MKTTTLICALLLGLAGCTKNVELVPTTDKTPINANNPTEKFDAAGQKLVAQGSFMNSARYNTSGTAKIYEKDGKRTLVFEDFKTDNGPDLRVYLAEDKNAAKFVEIAKLGNTGNFFLELPTTADPAKQKFVLIWCKQFTVLFGNAELK